MRTTVRLNDALLDEAKREARRRGGTLTSLIEEGLRKELAHSKPGPRRKVVLPVSKCRGGVMPGVDLTNNASLRDILEEGLPLHKLR
ncbi:Antitoxin VapB25 [Candidatus Sulfopaludibacter sp. SbA4]|nr:Antitoxin VapB25 [Candidatus Sulfopaludibacter sp. SbA4]